jgi:hypothetical protein
MRYANTATHDLPLVCSSSLPTVTFATATTKEEGKKVKIRLKIRCYSIQMIVIACLAYRRFVLSLRIFSFIVPNRRMLLPSFSRSIVSREIKHGIPLHGNVTTVN